MSTKPTHDGVYRIKVAGKGLYVGLNSNLDVYLDGFHLDSNLQKWNITVNTTNNTFTAKNAANDMWLAYTLTGPHDSFGKGYLVGSLRQTMTWQITEKLNESPKHSQISSSDSAMAGLVIDARFRNKIVHFAPADDSQSNQDYVFEEVNSSVDFERAFFNLTVAEAQRLGPYDIIVVGTGIGGGVVAADMFATNSKLGDKAKSILVIEKGGLVFHTHCLNTARPEGLGADRGQQNDSFFALFKEDFNIDLTGGKPAGGLIPKNTWKGGPMYCVGGRSAAWGLFSPRVHDFTLRTWFPDPVYQALRSEYFEKAEKLFTLSLPNSKIIHQHLLERLNLQTPKDFGVNWQWGRIASEFKDERNFDFAEGAYSTIDKLLEIMMSKPYGPNNAPQEHKNFKMLIKTEVRKILVDSAGTATGVVVTTAKGGQEQTISLKPGGRVILAAGSVASPAILLRSKLDVGTGAGQVTDHDILYRSLSFRYLNPERRQEVGAMKLQTYFDMGLLDGRVGLANMSIDASSFLPRGNTVDKNLAQMIMAFILPCPLEDKNSVTMVADEPRVKMIRTQAYSDSERQTYMKRMQDVMKHAFDAVEEHFKVEFVTDKLAKDTLSYLELGGVAHELGSLPMTSPKRPNHSIDENLKLENYQGIYVCDLSIFPMSPEANPTLTLAALAIRLSRFLHPRDHARAHTANTIWVINHSGEVVRVWLSNKANVTRGASERDAYTLMPGEEFSVERKSGIQEAIMVFRLDKAAKLADPNTCTFSKEPDLFVGHPGESCGVKIT
ncbi:hypothetical protein RSOLAG22IIIB_10398 [Rhizoctonia solani]|uniref:Uncharacterized protein n=1 Tax=Rhizoctonia solani TaxID=456999 RepID=A0A0K6G3X2_9AGAM|nr:hypothetical protein RSOLAG22IIIB_10398 [Rhizoctonia solani]